MRGAGQYHRVDQLRPAGAAGRVGLPVRTARRPPHPDTVERVFALLGAQDLADHTGAYLMGRTGTVS